MEPELDEEIRFRKNLYVFSITTIFIISLIGLLFCISCNSMPDLIHTADDVFDDAIKITVDKTVLQQNTDVNINIDVKNKDIK